MAKWGEGDPRWIVEERSDATNVNNWHWTEKNATGWSQDKLRALLEGLKIQDDNYCCEIKEVTKVDGEASASNRKAKLIFFYEWNIKAEWKGKVSGGDSYHKGTLTIPNLSEEYEPEEVDVEVSANNEKEDAAYKLKEFMRKKGSDQIRQVLSTYVKELKEEFSQGMILPAKDTVASNKSSTTQSTNAPKQSLSQPVTAAPSATSNVGVKINCKKITDKESFKCQASDIYRALTEKEMVRAFTRGEAVCEAEPGGKFSLFGGNVTGEFKSLVPFKSLQMRWRFKSWPEEHYSDVTIKLEELEDSTTLTLTQTGVPANDLERTRQGWKNYYWESLKQTFGFGSRLF